MNQEVRLRFAPSPTGALHIGGIRTALYNYLFARKAGGQFIIRIEDTDQNRYVEGAENYILRSLEWLGLVPDEGPENGGPFGPYRQSERKSIYWEHALKLLDAGAAYYAFDSAEELEMLRQSGDSNQKYDAITRLSMRNSLNMPEAEWRALVEAGHPFVIRLKVQPHEEVNILDAIRGQVSFQTNELDDKVLIKSDGLPTYHMANVVDDRLMKISHVIRGEEWLPSTAHHCLLYKAFGWQHEMPQFAHLPLIMKPSGNGKLSKRDGAQFGFPVFPMDWVNADGSLLQGFKEFGFEPQALLNFLAFLGWHPDGDQEVFTVEEMTSLFSLDKIVKSGARFDFEKSKWFNQQHLTRIPESECRQRISTLFANHGVNLSSDQTAALHVLYKDRVHFMKDYWMLGAAYFQETLTYDAQYLEQKLKPSYLEVLEKLKMTFPQYSIWNAQEIHQNLQLFIQENNIKPGELFPLLRVVITGTTNGPDVFKMLEFTGQQKMVARIEMFLHHIQLQSQ